MQCIDTHKVESIIGDRCEAPLRPFDEAQRLHTGAGLPGAVQVHLEEADGWAQLPEDLPQERLSAAVRGALRTRMAAARGFLYIQQ